MWPALKSSTSPEPRCRMPSTAETKKSPGFSREISSLTARITDARLSDRRSTAPLVSALDRAMKRAAGTPLPATSPIMKNKRDSSRRKAS